MTLGSNIRQIRKNNNMTIMDVCKITNLSKSTISDIENNKSNPSSITLDKLAKAFSVDISSFFNIDSTSLDETTIVEFKTAADAMKFILEQPIVMGFGGFDSSKLTDQDKIDFANDLLNQLQLLGLKYTRNK